MFESSSTLRGDSWRSRPAPHPSPLAKGAGQEAGRAVLSPLAWAGWPPPSIPAPGPPFAAGRVSQTQRQPSRSASAGTTLAFNADLAVLEA